MRCAMGFGSAMTPFDVPGTKELDPLSQQDEPNGLLGGEQKGTIYIVDKEKACQACCKHRFGSWIIFYSTCLVLGCMHGRGAHSQKDKNTRRVEGAGWVSLALQQGKKDRFLSIYMTNR